MAITDGSTLDAIRELTDLVHGLQDAVADLDGAIHGANQWLVQVLSVDTVIADVNAGNAIQIYVADPALAGDITATLPDGTTDTGIILRFSNRSATQSFSIAPAGADTINGSATPLVLGFGEAVTLLGQFTDWIPLSSYSPPPGP